MLRKWASVLVRYPRQPGVRPQTFGPVAAAPARGAHPPVLSVQLVPNRFYFLLFGALARALRARHGVRAEWVVVRSVSAAMGSGVLAECKRSALAARLFCAPWIRAYGGLVDAIAYRCASTRPLDDLIDWLRSQALWRQLQQAPASLKIGGVEVADLVLDSYLRFKPAPAFDVHDPFVRRLVWQALRDVRRAQAYFSRVRPRCYLTSYSTYLEHGIAARVALQNDIAVWSFGNLNSVGKQLRLDDSFHTPDFSGYRTRFDALDARAARLAEARVQLELRLAGGIDTATSYMQKSAYGQSSAPVPEGLHGAVVVFLHDFYDSPHVYPDLVFDDFWQWICVTIDALTQAGVPFFLKPHPNQIALSDQALAGLRAKYPALRWLSSEVSNVQLVAAGMACGVTVYGTVAHELAYLGVPSIACARHPHHAFDFCRTARNRAEYLEMLRSHAVCALSREQMQEQALAFFYMHNLSGDAQDVQLRQSYATLWKLCAQASSTEAALVQAFEQLVSAAAFARLLDAIGETMAPRPQ